MIGSGELLVILLVILILFGGKRLPEFAQSLGKGIREFKKACNGEDEMPHSRSEMTPKEGSPPSISHDSSKDNKS